MNISDTIANFELDFMDILRDIIRIQLQDDIKTRSIATSDITRN